MKIAVTATGPDLAAKVDPRFGRCPCFLIVETDDLSFEAVENPNVSLGGGAGIQSAQLMAERGVKHVLTGNCGPNAHQTLTAAGIDVIVGCSGSVREAIEQFKAGRLAAAAGPNVAGHFGTGGASQGVADPADSPPTGFGPGMGRGGGRGIGGGQGMGRGGGRGMGGGKGQGRGMGRGGGRGMGGGQGMGMGRGMGMGAGGGFAGSQPTAENAVIPDDELNMLKQQTAAMGQQMQQIQQRIKELEQEKKNG